MKCEQREAKWLEFEEDNTNLFLIGTSPPRSVNFWLWLWWGSWLTCGWVWNLGGLCRGTHLSWHACKSRGPYPLTLLDFKNKGYIIVSTWRVILPVFSPPPLSFSLLLLMLQPPPHHLSPNLKSQNLNACPSSSSFFKNQFDNISIK